MIGVSLRGQECVVYQLARDTDEKSPKLQEYWQMVRSTCDRGDNQGYNQYITLDDFLSKPLRWSYATVYCVEQKGKLVAGVMVQQSLMARSDIKCLAAIHFYRVEEFTGSEVYRELVRLGESLAKSLGYSCAETSLFITNKSDVLVLKQEDYEFAVCMEDVITDPKGRLTCCLTMYKDLGVIPPVVLELPQTEPDRPEDFMGIKPPQVTFLPVDVPLKSGHMITIRNMRNDECMMVYELYRDSAGRGDGYAIDEYTGLADFVKDYILEYYTVMLCDKVTGDLMGVGQVGRTVFSRIAPGGDLPVCDAHIAMTPKYIGKGFAAELYYYLVCVCKELGFTSQTNDTLLTQLKMIKVLRNLGFVLIGGIPKTTYVKGIGWIDCVYLYKDMKNIPTLSETSKIMHKSKV